MKRLIIYIMAAAAMMSCTKFLDIKPYGETIPQTVDEFSSLLHAHLESIDEGEEYIFGNIDLAADLECYADNLDANLTKYPAGAPLRLYVGAFLREFADDRYERIYSKIRDCNIIIEGLPETTSQEAKDVLGTSLVIRGLCYFNLLREYCEPCCGNLNNVLGVPLVTEFDMEEKPIRSSAQQTFKRIEEDYLKAIECNISKDVYRFNTDVIEGLLARLYFWVGDFVNSEKYARKVLAKYPLLDAADFSTMMNSLYSYTPRTEMLMKSCIISINSKGYSSTLSTIKARPASRDFVALFAEKEKDVRYALSFNSKRENQKNHFACVRSAEMQLILAESLYHQGDNAGALSALNELRRHRIEDAVDLTDATLPAIASRELIQKDALGNDLTPLLYAIFCERRKELYMEGDRWFELKRNGRPEFWVARQGRKYTTMKFMYTWPLPINDVELVEGLIQNEGYENVE